ncbi:MAG TPA: cytochrome c [Rhodocyclaceae bacterium]|nr:cytochrome c [Rhodocyclaceae bacterium]
MKTIGLLVATLVICNSAIAADTDSGKAVFERVCAACHLPSGEGIPGAFPPLAKSDYFRKATPAQLVKILSNGLNGPVTVNGQTLSSAMPPPEISDEEAAAVLNYVSVALNSGKANFTTEQIKKLKAAAK